MGIGKSLLESRESGKETPEMTARLANIERIEAMSPEDFDSTATVAKLSEAETAAMKHMRDSSQWLTKFTRQAEVRDLYFAAKHPTLSRIFQKLNIGLDNPYDAKELDKLDKQGEQFSYYDFEQALEKMQKTLG